MNFEELGQKSYHEWAKGNGYTATKKQLLNTSKEQLKQFQDSFIKTRLESVSESVQDCIEAFWAMLDELQVASEIRRKCLECLQLANVLKN